MKLLLVVTTDHNASEAIQNCLDAGWRIGTAQDRDQALNTLRAKRYDFVFIDLQLLCEGIDGSDYRAALVPFWDLNPSVQVVVMASADMIRKAVEAVKAGARDYLTYPIDPDEVRYLSENVLNAIIIQSELSYSRGQFWQSNYLELVQTNSPIMREVFSKIRSVAPTRSTVLLAGETGTGKNLMANLIHHHSNRRKSQFISVHCGAIPDTLIESELFGHEKGAFTGAIRRKLGKFEIARGGTIFLDEIGTITPAAQIKLLQILQDGTFQRVGGEETLDADVRVITASNTDLKQLCETRAFRNDLYYRLNVFPIEIPPLRDRLEDIPLLCEVLLKKLRIYYTKDIQGIHPTVLEAFRHYHWPGNIRELENLLERAAILETSGILTPESFPVELFEGEAVTAVMPKASNLSLAQTRQLAVEEIERRYLKDVLGRYRGKIKESAKHAGITSRQLNKIMHKYNIHKEEFKG